MQSADADPVPELRQAWKCFVVAGILAGLVSASWLLMEVIWQGHIHPDSKIFLSLMTLYILGSLSAFRKPLPFGLFLLIAILVNFVGLLACLSVLQTAGGWIVLASTVPLMWVWFRAGVAVLVIRSQRW